MALYVLVFLGGTPVGAPLIGALAEAFGPRSSMVVGGGVTALAGVLAACRARAGAVVARRGAPRAGRTSPSASSTSRPWPPRTDVRLFVSLRPPPAAVAHLRAQLPQWPGDPGRWHVTLAFLGDDADPGRVHDELAGAAARARRPSTCSCAGSGSFGRGRCGSASAATCPRCTSSPPPWQRRRGLGSDRPYRPHLTVGRRVPQQRLAGYRGPDVARVGGGAGPQRPAPARRAHGAGALPADVESAVHGPVGLRQHDLVVVQVLHDRRPAASSRRA